MPKVRESQRLIPKLHRRNYEDISMYFFIIGQRSIMPAISVEKAMYNYFKYVGENEFNIESSMMTYFRMQKEYNEGCKS